MRENFIFKGLKFSLWSKYSKSVSAQAYREIMGEGFFDAHYLYGYGKEVYAFDLVNGLFLHCQSEASQENDRLITIVEYELYGGYYLDTTHRYTFRTNWKFHLKCLPVLSVRMDNSNYNKTENFFNKLHVRNQEVINSTRKRGYEQWRNKMKQKGWLIDREVDNRIMAERRGESVPEIVPMEELM